MERLFPQCGQYTTLRPSGSVPPQNRHPSGTDALIIDDSAAGAAFDASGGGSGVAGGAGDDTLNRAETGAGTGGAAGSAGGAAGAGSSELATVSALMRRNASGASETLEFANSLKAPGSMCGESISDFSLSQID